MVSGIYSMVNGNYAHNNYYQWANTSVNNQGELVFLSLQKLDNTYFRIILCEPLPIWCYNLLIQNQIEESIHFRLSFGSTDYDKQCGERIDRIKNEQYVTGCFSYVTKTIKFEEL